jgi:hypothetical protein
MIIIAGAVIIITIIGLLVYAAVKDDQDNA